MRKKVVTGDDSDSSTCVTEADKDKSHNWEMSEGIEVTYLVLVNSKSGGQDGPQLLERFREMASQPAPQGLRGEVVSLTDPQPDGTGVIGPRPGLEKFKDTRNLRVIGKSEFKI